MTAESNHPPWTRRWWRSVGDVLWQAKHQQAILEWIGGDKLWGIRLTRAGKPDLDLVMDLDANALMGADKVEAETREPLAEMIRARARGTSALNADQVAFLRSLATALSKEEWVLGRVLRQQMKATDKDSFMRQVGRLVPRFVRVDTGDLGDYYSLTLAGLVASGDQSAVAMLGLLLQAIQRRYNIDAAARNYDWDDLSAVGVGRESVKLAYYVANIAQLSHGASMGDGSGDRPNIRLGLPQDVEELVTALETKTFDQYIVETANRPRRGGGWRVERPFWAAPLHLDDDGSQGDFTPVGVRTGSPNAGFFDGLGDPFDDEEELDVPSCNILFLASNPISTQRLSLDEEARDIQAKIRSAAYRDAMTFRTRWAVRPDDLLQALNEDRPTVVHFSGHGAGSPGIVLSNDSGGVKLVTAGALKHLFNLFKDDIRVVVLNACYSAEQAEAIVEVIDCVIGMDDTVDDEAAWKFAASFYRALGFGRSVKHAFEQGIAILKLDGLPDEQVPQLLVRPGVDADAIVVVT